MSDSKSSKASNLARIRDNQRRSRARRKEYLQELEAKLRSCEQMGIGASAEMQKSARKVLDENRKLRALLRERGVSEADILAAMGATDNSNEAVFAAPELDSMLGRRIPCSNSTGHEVSITPASHGNVEYILRTPHVAPISIPPQRAITYNNHNNQHESTSPHSIASSSVGTPPSLNNVALFPNHAHVHAHAVREVSRAEDVAHLSYSMEHPLNPNWAYSPAVSFAAEPDKPLVYPSVTSSFYAANVIRTMRHDVSSGLETDLGCHIIGPECSPITHNPAAFLEKYVDPGYGI